MRTIGLLGGMSWESSLEYYRLVNSLVRDRLGGTHSARCVLLSVDFAEIEDLQEAGDWAGAADVLSHAARAVESAGAECLVICTNTMHRVADDVAAAVSVPLIHIADPTGEAIVTDGLTTVGLLGTRYTMEADFYRGRLESDHGLDVLIPARADRELVHRVIYDELVRGIIDASSRERYVEVIDRLVADGAQGVILGCTEIGLLVDETVTDVPLYDTTVLHAAAAVSWSLDG